MTVDQKVIKIHESTLRKVEHSYANKWTREHSKSCSIFKGTSRVGGSYILNYLIPTYLQIENYFPFEKTQIPPDSAPWAYQVL